MEVSAATSFNAILERAGAAGPWAMLVVFLGASFLMIWRLEHMAAIGMEGTVLGTLIMPYCSGIGNLLLVYVVERSPAAGREILINGLVNNTTNLTLLLGVPGLFWGMSVLPGKKGRKARPSKKEMQTFRIHRLSLVLSLVAVFFFTGAAWALARDGRLDTGDGLVLIGLFLFWQCFQVYDVLQHNVRSNQKLHPVLVVDILLLGIGAWGIYFSLDWLVQWLSKIESGFISAQHLGWLSGWLMVLPNAMLAIYYAAKGRPEVTYASQIGDGHICIPLCIGLYALRNPMDLPHFFNAGVQFIVATAMVHLLFLTTMGRLPRFVATGLIGAYAWFLYHGLGQ